MKDLLCSPQQPSASETCSTIIISSLRHALLAAARICHARHMPGEAFSVTVRLRLPRNTTIPWGVSDFDISGDRGLTGIVKGVFEDRLRDQASREGILWDDVFRLPMPVETVDLTCLQPLRGTIADILDHSFWMQKKHAFCRIEQKPPLSSEDS